MRLNGNCLCKAVKFSFETNEPHFHACHCSMCRNWGGGPAFAVQAQGNIQFTGEEHLKTFTSSDWAERGFCAQCGSHLFYRLKDHSFMNFNLGAIEGHESFKFSSQVYIDNKPENYSFSNETLNMTEQEILDKFS